MMDTQKLRSSLSVVRSAPSLRLQALENLRRGIIDGKLPPGTRLIERKLCDVLGVSRTIVREILRQLEAEGWVKNPPYKGPIVATISMDEARQIYEMRAALEGLASKLCAERATSEQLKQLDHIVEDMTIAQSHNDIQDQVRAVERFYDVLLQGAGNAMLTSYLRSQHDRLALLRTISLSQPERTISSIAEKKQLASALRNRDGAAAQLASEYHVQQAAKAAAASFLNMQAAQSDSEKPKQIKQPRAAARRPIKRS
jgi:DNA-binding GntR family transcriptional regulator